MADPRPELARALTLFDAVMIVMGTIIGIGIFFTPSRVAADTGSTSAALLAWFAGTAVALCGALTYARLGRRLPLTGGPYVFLREGLGPLAAFLYGWMLLAAIVSGAIAVIGLVFVDHLARLVPVADPLRPALAALLILALTAVNALGVKFGSRVLNFFTVLKVVALALLIVAGAFAGREPIAQRLPDAADGNAVAGFFAALVGVMFAFGGWQNLTNVAGEVKDSARAVPRAIVLGVLGVALVYAGANLALFRMLPIAELVGSKEPVAAALARAVGPRAGDLAAALILCSAFGILNGLLLAAPRIYFAMARDGCLPAALGAVHPTRRTPLLAILVQGAVSAAIVLLFVDVSPLLDYVVFADWLFFTLNALALLVLLRREGAARRAFVIPGAFLLAAAAVTGGVLVAQWQNARFGLLLLAVGVAVFALARRGAGGRYAGRS